MAPLIGLFWTSGDISSGFRSHSGQPYLCLQRHMCSSLLWYLLTSWQPAWQLSWSLPHTWDQALVGLKTETYGATDEDYRLSYADAAHSWVSYFHIKTWMLTIVFRLHYDRLFNTFYVNILIVLSFCFHVFWQTVVDRKYFWLPRPEGAANHIRIVNPLQHQGHHLWALVC